MVSVILALVLVLALPTMGQAATYYVATTGSNGNSCSAAQSESTPKLTIAGGVGCMSSGDTLIIKPGTYTNQGISNPPGGSASAYTIISGDPALARPVIRADYTATQRGIYCSRGETCRYMEFRHLEITNAHQGVRMDGSDTIGYAHHIRLIDSYVHDNAGTGFQVVTSSTGFLGGDNLIQNVEFAYNGILNPDYPPGVNNIYSPGNRTIIERCTFHHVQNGIGIWASGKYMENVIIRDNLFYNINRHQTDTWQVPKGAAIHVSSSGGGHQIYNNVIYASGDDALFSAIRINPQFGKTSLTQMNIYNNTIYNLTHASAAAIHTTTNVQTANSVAVRNNLVISGGAGIVDQLGTSMVTAGNITSGTASSLFTNTGTNDLTLKAGSAAINAGSTTTGLSYCENAPDVGAFETLKVLSAVMTNGHFIDVTICTTKPPVQIGTWTPGCTGTGCGTPVASSASLIGGGIVRVDVGGITGGNCAAGQTWTISSGSGNTDSARVGNTLNQPLHTTTNFSVDSSACDGGGPTAPPSGTTALYEWEDDCNDSSGNANHATCSGTSFVTGKFTKGLQTNQNETDYADTGLLSGHNPASSHLVVSTWVYIDPAHLNDTADVFGTSLGIDQRFFVFRSSANVWQMGAGATSGTASEFPVVSGWTHVCAKGNPTTDVMTLYINGEAGTVSGASVISYGSYTFASTLRFGLPSGFSSTLSGNHIFDRSRVYTTDVSCPDIYSADQPATPSSTATQVAHQWEQVFTKTNGTVTNVGGPNDEITAVSGAALVVQYNCEGGDCPTVQPRFRYNVDGGEFANATPDMATADGVEYWGEGAATYLNAGAASGPLTGALSHVNGITLRSSAGIPTVAMSNNSSRTIRGLFYFTSDALNKRLCFKLYDQGGQPFAGYTPSEGACLRVVPARAGIQ